MSIRRKHRDDGFALLEVMFAIVILAVGLLGLAALMAQLSGTTTQSRYLGAEVMLASEKLEGLNHIGPSLTAGGDLASNKTTSGIAFFDQVQISSRNGVINDPSGAGGTANDMMTFTRRWIIESDTPAPKVQRITVIVIPQTGTALEQAATFQTSTVRRCDPINGC